MLQAVFVINVPGGVGLVVEITSTIVAVPLEGTVTQVGLITTVGPGGETVADRHTVPLNPHRLVIVFTTLALVPGKILTEEGLAVSAKSKHETGDETDVIR